VDQRQSGGDRLQRQPPSLRQAQSSVASAVLEGSHLLVQLLFTPLLAGWSIWAGIAISTRSSDVQTTQRLAVARQPSRSA
jgi:hypothetical protein